MKKVPNDLLRRARESRGWTQQRLADEVVAAEQTVGSWERGTRFPGMRHRRRLVELFDLTPEQLGLVPVPNKEKTLPENIAISVPPLFQGKGSSSNRSKMLKRVRSRWVTGVLEQSYQTLVPLTLQEQPDAILNPWREAVQEANLSSRARPGTSVMEIYDEADGELLILGEPGAGKTTLLLMLTRDLLDRASIDDAHPLPVVFNLSSWAERRQPLTDWLVEELQAKYQVPLRLGREWVSHNHILPLLDGLDEVAEQYRTTCIENINSYRQERGFVPMVVCCRGVDYFMQPTRIMLQNAVVIQPLTTQQIDEYIVSAGVAVKDLRTMVQHEPAWQEIASNPLMLSVIVSSYDGMSLDTMEPVHSISELQPLVFEKYVDRVLQRRGPNYQYPQEQTKHWLAWLAQHLVAHNQTEFYIEQMQPDWLPDPRMLERYRKMVIRVIMVIEIAVVCGLNALLRGDSVPTKPGLFFWLGGGLGSSVLGWMAPGLGGALKGSGSLEFIIIIVILLIMLLVGKKIPTLSLKTSSVGIIRGVRNGLISGGILGISSVILYGLSGQIAYGIYRGLGLAFYGGLMAFLTFELIVVFDIPKTQKQQSSFYLRDRVLNFFLFGLSGAFGFVCLFTLQAGEIHTALIDGTLVFLFVGAVYGLGNGTTLLALNGLGIMIQPAETVMWSWYAARKDLADNMRKGAFLGGFILMSVVVVIACISSLFYGWQYGLRYGFIFGFIAGFIACAASILAVSLTDGWSSDILTERQQFRPNEGILRSMRNAAFAACLFGSIGGIISGMMSGFAFAVIGGLSGWFILGMGFTLIFGIFFALQFALISGGAACIKHYTLRWYLWRMGYMPWNYVRFLDAAAERILLRRVGGGYIFAHRLLLDYFAKLS